MEISWLGHSCFLLRGKNVTLITDPFSPQLGHSLGKINAPIVTISHNHPGHNYAEGVGGNPYVVRGPGEYEISDVLITGVASYHDNKRGQERGRNTIYVIPVDDQLPTGDAPNPLDKFCREMGIETINTQPKLSITRSSLPAETQVVILSSRG